MMALDGGRIGISCQAIGIARAALEESIAYAKERKQFDKAIAEFQATQWKLADMQTELDAAHMLALRAAWLK
jgi:alkylation response protein AidB-like acyl-CoA dehydrogenase